MRRGIILSVLAVVVLATLVWAGQKWGPVRGTFTHTIDQTGDTAKIVSLGPSTGLDSFLYIDTIAIYTATDSTAVAVTYQAHPLKRRVAVGATIDTTHIDTIIIDLGTNTDTIAYTVPNIAGFTRAAYIDSIVARGNALAGCADTIAFEDSSTFIMLRSKIAQIGCEGDARWTVSYGTASAANNNMSAGTALVGDSTTIALVVDSLVYKINNTATVKDTVTAADSATLVYLTGRAGYRFRFNGGDTTQDGDTTVVQEAAQGESYDTLDVPLPVRMWELGCNTLMGYASIKASPTTTKGYGTLDSVWFYLYKTWDIGGTVLMGGDSGALPRNWHIVFDSKADTVYGDGPMFLRVVVMDTATDTSGARYHDLDYSLTATE